MKSDVLCCVLLCAVIGAWTAEGQNGEYAFTTIAGLVGTNGSANGTNNAALFNFPAGIAVDSSGNLFVADILNHTIRKLTQVNSNWVVTTIAGQVGMPGSADGTNQSAQFDRPNGVAIDRAGNLIVVDHYNHTIRKLSPVGTNWVVSTIAGLAGVTGNADGTNSDARFWSPTGVTVGTNGHIYVTDTANFTVREIVPSGTNWVVGTIAGVALNYGFADGTNGGAQFDFPFGITSDSANRLYVADWGNNAIRVVEAFGQDWAVSTLAGNSGATGTNDGPGWLASFNSPTGICLDLSGALYVADQENNTLRKLVGSGTNWVVSTIGGVPSALGGYADGLGTNALFRRPWGITVDTSGTLYLADYDNQAIRSGTFIPALAIRFAAGQALLSWTSTAGNYAPEVSAGLGARAAWAGLANTPVTNGLNVSVSDPLRTTPAFYRLIKVQSGPSPQVAGP